MFQFPQWKNDLKYWWGGISLLVLILVLFWWYKNSYQNTKTTSSPVVEILTDKQKAISLAIVSDCINAGDLTDNVYYNNDSQTWWIDIAGNKPGCNPACVVDIVNQTTEINWRCTGLITNQKQPYDIVEAILRKLFSEKYNKPIAQIQVKLDFLTDNHTRGSVQFAPDGEGGIFLAARVKDNWQIVFDGNGSISCQLVESFDFPTEMVSDCAN